MTHLRTVRAGGRTRRAAFAAALLRRLGRFDTRAVVFLISVLLLVFCLVISVEASAVGSVD